MSMFEFAKSTISRALGKETLNLPFTIGDVVDQAETSFWTLHKGTKKEDGSPVTVFNFDAVRNRDKLPLARNALKRFRTLRHPDIPKFIDGAETDAQIVFATEPLIPLSAMLKSNSNNDNLISWGLYKLANVIKFLNADCSLIHGNLRVSSIFCTKAGDWNRPEDLGPVGQIPPPLYVLFKSLIAPDPRSRGDMGSILERGLQKRGYFDNEFIQVSLFLEQISIKDAHEKDQFLRKLHGSLDSFPLEFCKYKVLPELINALEFGGASAKALTPILKIGSKLQHDEFEALIVPIIVKLFASPDRSVRITLCENLGQFVEHLSPKIVNDKIFPNLATGFNDTSAVVREHTVKSVLLIIQKLTDRIINNDLLRYLAKLQMDEEPGIRTNTTICLGKISKHLNETSKKKVLIAAFSRSLNDPFPPARNAGLLAFAATLDYYEPQDIAQKVIPCISPLLIDTEKPIRTQAFKDIELCVKKLEKHAQTMPETAVVPKPGDAASQPNAANAANAANDGWGMAGWAVSAISTKAMGLTSSLLRASDAPSTGVSPSASVNGSTAPSNSTTPAMERKPPIHQTNGIGSTGMSSSSSSSSSVPRTSMSSATNMRRQSSEKKADGWGDGWDNDLDLEGQGVEKKCAKNLKGINHPSLQHDSWEPKPSNTTSQTTPSFGFGSTGQSAFGGSPYGLGGPNGNTGGSSTSKPSASKPKSDGWDDWDNEDKGGWGGGGDGFGDEGPAGQAPQSGFRSPSPSSSTHSVDSLNFGSGGMKSPGDREAEREKRRQRMAELREQRRASKLGAKKM
ncbi:hypothetical protein HK102_004122 [Quaeritorhiza haematococci]|nr:hypothetical protein HK102_004122 [Quaeritorhiza haematococci]